jgi:DNA-binding CsgD family transcriptional regulator/tetratricopeptide (TPR) repeat protein
MRVAFQNASSARIVFSMPLLERDGLLAELSILVDSAAEGHGHVAAILGEAGVGKTSLLNELARRARDRSRILLAGCEALFTPRPLGPLYDLAEDLDLDVDSPREKLFPDVLAAIATTPTLLIVEDVHWADRATLDLLKYIARRIGRTPALLALSYRDDEVGSEHPLITLLGEAPVRRLRVEPLSREAVVGLGGDGEIYRLTGGNPFYVTEVLANRGHDVPPTVRDAVLARAAALAPPARAVIEFASLIPGRADLSLIEAGAEDIESAARSGIVRIEQHSIVFRHELGRRAIEDTLSDARRIPMHRQILTALRAAETSSSRLPGMTRISLARLAHHAVGARDADAILEYCPLAALEAARAGAHREAAAHYRSALAYSGRLSDPERAALIEALTYECYLTEQVDEALQRRVEALAIWRAIGDRRREGDNLRWQSRFLWFLGRNPEARVKAREAIAALEPLGASSELAMAYSNQAQLHMLAQEYEQAIHFGTRAIDMATRLGDDAVLSHALNNVGVAELQRGGTPEKVLRSLEIALAHGHQEHVARAYTNLGSALVSAADYGRGRRYLDEGIAWCRERDLDSWVLYMSAWRARHDLETGHWESAVQFARTVLAHGGTSAISRMPALVALGRTLSRRGDPEAALLLDEARDLAIHTGEFQRIAPIAAARAEAAWLRGDVEAIAPEADVAFAHDVYDPWQQGDLALHMWRAGALQSPPDHIAEPYALQIAGRWRDAASAFDAVSRPWEAAAALSDGDDTEALQDAIVRLEHLGDGVLVERIRQKLRALGVRGPRPSTRNNPAGLTPREIEILALLEEGLRNSDIAARLFVSAKTVDHHVSSILAKLGAKTRGEAARKWKTLGVGPK